MPLIHRIACLRDDLVFFVYLYQRRIYPVDKKRVNEFGRAYEDSDDDEKEGEAKKEEDKKGEEATAGDKGDASRAKKESKKRR
jgi:chromatin remodeling complex protein RSC6